MTHVVPTFKIYRLREAVRIVRGQMVNLKSGVVGYEAFMELVRSSTALLKASRLYDESAEAGWHEILPKRKKAGEETHG